MPSIKAWKQNWGFLVFCLDIVASFAMLFIKNVAGHYINYTAPAEYLWSGRDAYGIGFPGSPGAFFYSPGCALFFFGFFNLFPQKLGQALYMLSSFTVFWLGLMSLLNSLKKRVGFDLVESPYRNIFWLMVGSEAIGAIVAVKIDILIVGVLCWAVASLIERKHETLSFLFVGLVTSWKLHPISIVGLLIVGLAIQDFKQALKASMGFAGGVAVGFLTPFIVLPWDFVISVTKHWMTSLSDFIAVAWLDNIFQHIYGFLVRAFGWPIDLTLANRITTGISVMLAAVIALAASQTATWSNKTQSKTIVLLAGLGLGSGFGVLFSQLIQSNSYIVYIPLVIAWMVYATLLKYRVRSVLVLMWVAYIIISLVYSDLNPRPLYHMLYHYGVKPVGVLVLFLPTLWALKQIVQLRPKS